VEGEFF
jgi:hypothetical protein